MWSHRFAVNILEKQAPGVLTNVPGPTEQLHILGAPVTTMMFWVPQAGEIGLGISILSLNGSVRVGVTSDAAIIQEPGELAQAFADEFAALAAEFGVEAAAEPAG